MAFKRGDKVRIKKGTTIKSTHPVRQTYTAGRSYTITICDFFHVLPCRYDTEVTGSVVVWVGSGGYRCEANSTDVEKGN